MQPLPLIIVLIFGLPIAFAWWLMRRVTGAHDRVEQLSERVRRLERDLSQTKERMAALLMNPDESNVREPAIVPKPTVEVATPPPMAFLPRLPERTVIPPHLETPREPKPTEPAVNWEHFMGVKGFAWVGGLALFLGVAFFIKYSFDNNLISPAFRATLGFLTGLGLIAGGIGLSRKNNAALSQTLCATGVVVLYAITFACHALYHFELFGLAPTFLLMGLITAAAFVLAGLFDALVVAILGMLGGFLTPVLLSTGGDSPLALFGYIAVLDAGLILVALNRRWHFLSALAAIGTIIMQVGWASRFFVSERYFHENKILITLGILLGFNLLYLAANILAKGQSQSNPWLAGSNFGLAATALAFTSFFFTFPELAQRPVLLFSFVFLVDLCVTALAWVEASLSIARSIAGWAVFGLLVLWTSNHLTNELLGSALALYFVFALIECALPAWRRRSLGMSAGLIAQLNSVRPFLLLMIAIVRLPLSNPSSVFCLALVVALLLLGLTKFFELEWLPLAALAGVFGVECIWHFNQFTLADPKLVPPPMLLAWYLAFFALLGPFPFAFMKQFAGTAKPWAASALAGPAQFFLVLSLVNAAWPNPLMGLLPAAFAIPAFASFAIIKERIPPECPARLTQLAWFGGVALFFITMIFPVQFRHQWLTIGWALEGAALLWLFLRLPHPGLKLTGVGLLITAFIRLALNPAVLSYHVRGAAPIFNWYLYAYGVVTAALFVGARLLAPPRHMVLNSNARAVLGSMGAILLFLLLNIEIADYFSEPGLTLTFQFSGAFARDVAYSIGWALFALVLLIFGIAKRIPGARYAAMALLSITLLKLFLHDLARLGQLYRIGAFVGVAIIAMLASFAYQKFFSSAAKPS